MEITETAALLVYKTASLATGTCVIYFGYRLFLKGIFGESGDFEASRGDVKIQLKKDAPGTFFALFGTIIISFTLYQGFSITVEPEQRPQQEQVTEMPQYPDGKDIPLTPPDSI